MYSQPQYGYTPQQPAGPPQWPGMIQQPKRRASGCIKALVITAVAFVVIVGSCVYVVVKHPRWLLGVLKVEPGEYALAAAVSDGKVVHVLYHNESPIPIMTKAGDEPEFELGALAFHGTLADDAWSDVNPIEPFSSALWFQGALWAFHDGGCRKLINDRWETVATNTEWGCPVARLLGQKLCVFYVDANRTLRVATSADGRDWTPGKLERSLPKPAWDEDVISHFARKAHPPFRAVVLGNCPYVFWYDWSAGSINYICFNRGWTQPLGLDEGSEFDVITAEGRIYLFLLFDFHDNQDFRLEPAKVGVYTFDGTFWSERRSLGFTTSGCLNASRVGNDIWLFTSEKGRLVYRVLSNGRWSPPNTIPKPKNVWQRPTTTD
jgi:hypothetical protein